MTRRQLRQLKEQNCWTECNDYMYFDDLPKRPTEQGSDEDSRKAWISQNFHDEVRHQLKSRQSQDCMEILISRLSLFSSVVYTFVIT